MLTTFAILIGVFVATFAGVWQFRKFSLRKGLLDHPNERSSHETPTPRGGGLVLAIVAVIGYVVLSIASDSPVSYGYVIAALMVVMIGLLDDVYSVWFFWRLIGQLAAAIIFVALAGPIVSIYLPIVGELVIPHLLSLIVTSLFIVYFLNAYNFMDGIDGIAGLQAVVAGVCWFVVGSLLDLDSAIALGGSLAAASVGFLLLNWQPAKIFMGDAGSAFLGFSFAVLPIVAGRDESSWNSVLPVIGLLAVWPFIFDSIITLMRRCLRLEKVWSAHREHLYQRLVIGGWSHATVTTIYGTIALICSASAALFSTQPTTASINILVVTVVVISAVGIFAFATKYGGTK